MNQLMQGVTDFAVNLAESPWVFLAVFTLSALDAILPVLPAESIIVALAAINQGTGSPDLLILGISGGVGAFLGDNLTFHLGRLLGVERFAWMRRPRMVRAIAFARYELDRRAALLILTARYIPIGRTAVNLSAGATGFSYRRFLPLSAVAATTWASYAVAIGAVTGHWAESHPLIGAVIAVVVAITLGLLLDRVLAWWRRRRIDAAPVDPAVPVASAAETGTDQEPTAP